MQLNSSKMQTSLFRPLLSGILGITLLLPASFFMLALMLRVCFGSTTLYYSMAPSFLQSPFDFTHVSGQAGAQLIFCSLVLAILFNVLAILRFHLQRGTRGWEIAISYKRYWLNTAIALQSCLLLLILASYTLIQHIRY
jgi:hypothetical protein